MKLWQTKFSQKKLSDVVFLFLVLPMMQYVSGVTGDIACFWCWCYRWHFSGCYKTLATSPQKILEEKL